MANLAFRSPTTGFKEATTLDVTDKAFSLDAQGIPSVLGSFRDFTNGLTPFVETFLYGKGTSADRESINAFLTAAWEDACTRQFVTSAVRYSSPPEGRWGPEVVSIVGIRYDHPLSKTAHFTPVWGVSLGEGIHDPGIDVDGQFIGQMGSVLYYLTTDIDKKELMILEFWNSGRAARGKPGMKAVYISPTMDFELPENRNYLKVLQRAQAMGLIQQHLPK